MGTVLTLTDRIGLGVVLLRSSADTGIISFWEGGTVFGWISATRGANTLAEGIGGNGGCWVPCLVFYVYLGIRIISEENYGKPQPV
jgi:hypothetical protein